MPTQAKVRDCIKLHGAIFLGSLAWWQCAVEPSCEWVLQTLLAPVAGQGTAQTVSSALKHVGQVRTLTHTCTKCAWGVRCAQIAKPMTQHRWGITHSNAAAVMYYKQTSTVSPEARITRTLPNT